MLDALSTDQVERWWRAPGHYNQSAWTADPRVAGPWSAEVVWADAKVVYAEGEFCEVSRPGKLVMTRRFDNHPLMGTRETTITHRIEPREEGTRLTVRNEGLIGRTAAANGNAEHWERVFDLARRIHGVDLRGSATVVGESISSNEDPAPAPVLPPDSLP